MLYDGLTRGSSDLPQKPQRLPDILPPPLHGHLCMERVNVNECDVVCILFALVVWGKIESVLLLPATHTHSYTPYGVRWLANTNTCISTYLQ